VLDPSIRSIATVSAIVLATLAVAGPAGAADGAQRPDDRTMRGPGGIALTNEWAAAESSARPDDRPMHGPGAIEAARRDVLRPDDRADRRLPSSAPLAQPTPGNGFDWLDAGIGSAATLGLVLLVAGASMVRLRHDARAA
jgi:hypothetical protein